MKLETGVLLGVLVCLDDNEDNARDIIPGSAMYTLPVSTNERNNKYNARMH